MKLTNTDINQCADHLLMIRPKHFGFNATTAENNAFQNEVSDPDERIQSAALEEFDNAVEVLRSHGIKVRVFEDTESPKKPDAIFPNNWFSLHESGGYVTYGMYAANRRIERRQDIVKFFEQELNRTLIQDYDKYEAEGRFLEGTGSLILDRPNRIAYACQSQRTDAQLFDQFCREMNYEGVLFDAQDANGRLIYHTNVMLAIGLNEVVICLESVRDNDQRLSLLKAFRKSKKRIIDISLDQVNQFAGNMLQVRNHDNAHFWVMSESAYASLNEVQIHNLSLEVDLIKVPIPTIERVGGGGIRCMLGELF